MIACFGLGLNFIGRQKRAKYLLLTYHYVSAVQQFPVKLVHLDVSHNNLVTLDDLQKYAGP